MRANKEKLLTYLLNINYQVKFEMYFQKIANKNMKYI